MTMTLLPLLLATAATAGLSLDGSSPQRSVLVGEPLKLVVRWKADQDLQRVFVERGLFQEQSLSFVVDDGRGPKTYREIPHSTGDQVVLHGGMEKGQVEVANLLLVQGRYEGEAGWGGFLFRAPGSYSVKVVYTDRETGQSATSRTLRFTVREPSGEDREIFDAAKARPMMLALLGDAESQAKVKELIERHPRSPYLRWTRLRVLQERLALPDLELDPDTRDRLRRYDQDSLERRRAEQRRKTATEIFAETEWGAFEEEALALGIAAAEAAGDKDKAKHARDELFRKHPHSATVKRLKQEGNEADADDDREPMIRPLKPKPSPNLNQ
jgi:hypothetical protein